MFTGLVEEMGKVVNISKKATGLGITIKGDKVVEKAEDAIELFEYIDDSLIYVLYDLDVIDKGLKIADAIRERFSAGKVQ